MKCPPPLLLFQFAQGAVDASQHDAVAGHVKTCRACAAQLKRAPQPDQRAPAFGGLADALEPRAEHAATTNLTATSNPPASPSPSPSPRPRRRDVFDEDSATSIHPSSRSHGSRTSEGPFDEDSATRMQSSDRLQSSSSSHSSQWGGHAAQAGHTTLPRGTEIGRYLVVEPLGSGGLGDVYTAYDPELDRCIAIKVLRPSTESAEGSDGGSGTGTGSGSDRLMREAKALARLAHPNVVAVHDVGRVGDDVFIAMERVEGQTLSQWCRAQRRPWREIRDVFLGAGTGLAAAHDANIVHRDFKPQNVIVSADGRPRVLDFGLARAVQRSEGSGLISLPRIADLHPGSSQASLDGSITMEGTVMGTPQYMAPEQFEGSNRTGPAADQFGFCVALWVALYEQRPFQGEGIPGLIKAVCSGTITEPADRRGVPKWLHKVLLRGIATQPEDRFESMKVVLTALQRDKRSRRRQWIGLSMVALVSALGSAAAAVALRPPVTAEHRDEVESLTNEAQAAAARSYYVYPDPTDDSGVTAYRKILELEALEGPASELAESRASELRTELSETLVRLGDRYFDREGGKAFAADYYAAALIFDPDDAHARERTTLTPGEIGLLRAKAADGSFSAAELAAAASLAVLAVEDHDERMERLAALYSGDQAPSPSTSARLEALLGDEEAEVIARAVRPRRSSSSRKPKATPEPKDVFLPVGNAAPEPEPEPELELEPKSESPTEPVGKRDSGGAAALAKQGLAAFKKGQFQDAEALFHRALSLNRRNSTALGGLAELYFERGSYQKASQFASKAVDAAPRNGKYRIVLGDAYFKTLAYQSARREYEKAKALGHPSAAGRLSQLDKRLGK